MDATELSLGIDRLGLSKPDFARLLGVSHRAINLWLSSEREIPGPVEAYVRLLTSVPGVAVSKELARLKQEDPRMFEGMYLIQFAGKEGPGLGMLVLQGGMIYGHDGGVCYDGDYSPNPQTPGHLDLSLRVSVPPNVPLVTGVPAQAVGYWFDISCTITPRTEAVQIVTTPFGPVNVIFRRLRDIPDARAAA